MQTLKDWFRGIVAYTKYIIFPFIRRIYYRILSYWITRKLNRTPFNIDIYPEPEVGDVIMCADGTKFIKLSTGKYIVYKKPKKKKQIWKN